MGILSARAKILCYRANNLLCVQSVFDCRVVLIIRVIGDRLNQCKCRSLWVHRSRGKNLRVKNYGGCAAAWESGTRSNHCCLGLSTDQSVVPEAAPLLKTSYCVACLFAHDAIGSKIQSQDLVQRLLN